jgi:RND family efflux transporter MFP subunit
MNPLKVLASIQERYAALVRSDMPVEFEVEAYPGKKFQGKVAYISPSVDPSTRTFPVEIMVDNAQRLLRPGFFVKGVIFTRRDENVLAVPDKAIFTLAGVSSVYVIEQGKARQQIITVGTRIDGHVELLSGLNGDEILAASNLSLLATGVPVQIEGTSGTRDPSFENNFGDNNQGGQP